MAEESEPIGQDEDEKELIESVGDGVAPPITPKPEAEDEPEDKPEGDEPEVVETPAAPTPTADGAVPDAAGPAPAGDGSSGGQPVPEVAAPVTPAGGNDLRGVVGEPDAESFKVDPIIKCLDSAITKIEESDLIEGWEKDQKIAALLEQREGRVSKLTDGAKKQEDQFRDAKARELKITRAQLDQAWAEALNESHKTIGRHSHDAAMLVLAQKAAAMKKPAAAATPAPTKPAPPKAAAPTPITPKGARVAPPAAIVPPPPRAKSDEEELVDSVRREQKSGVRV